MKAPGIRERIKLQAVELIKAHPEGLHYSELFRRLRDGPPSFNTGTINSTIWNLDVVLPESVWKPSKGLYRHADYKEPEATDEPIVRAGPAQPKVRQDQFYSPFADWLKNEAEEATHAIPLGGNIFRDRWGTPDVIGKRESKRSDVIKVPTEIVAAEIKADTMQLVTAYGQACAYRLFSHRSYLVIPRQANADEIARLDALCEISGVGLVTFDLDDPKTPGFLVLVRPRPHQPDLFYTNRYLALIERELFS
ncbi:hypothetical protein LNV09_08865 [Paucibacter sp. B2R-40]|uniref:hypothetical protein n=1 Tax=Paucibacter sp. B2R-40 TaxID=2893554 RepID=UPI0021E3B8F8|nr:hypothetical protein [Paucibacter sp. B2R-40]MCV2354277.1 hypothetical protein [Paucibacter sp. B2R-40]